MDVTVRVMKDGAEIDRIIRPVRIDNGKPVVTYCGKLWHVVDGSIFIDEMTTPHEERPTWASLVNDLLPAYLPNQIDACLKVLNTCFRGNLAAPVAQAAASLTALSLEQQARALLVSVLAEHRDSDRLYRLTQLQVLFRNKPEQVQEPPSNSSAVTIRDPQPEFIPIEDLDWEWSPEKSEEVPDVDDSFIKAAAAKMQETIGAYRAEEKGTVIPGLDELNDETVTHQAPSMSAGVQGQAEKALLERTANLGCTALELLRYFVDNPGDKPVHAEFVLGYAPSEINRLLIGPLRPYMSKVGPAGCVCHSWVTEVLSALESTADEGRPR